MSQVFCRSLCGITDKLQTYHNVLGNYLIRTDFSAPDSLRKLNKRCSLLRVSSLHLYTRNNMICLNSSGANPSLLLIRIHSLCPFHSFVLPIVYSVASSITDADILDNDTDVRSILH